MRLDETYPVLRDCWIAGGQGAQVAPEAWRPLLDSDADESERRLLALAGQAFEVGLRPDLGPHTVRPPLPVLDRPAVPDRLRPTLRRVLRAEGLPGSGGSPGRVVDLLDRRGFVVSPMDWFPSANVEAPESYRPWQVWATAAATGINAGADTGTDTAADTAADKTSTDDWDALARPARRQLLRRLRGTDPAAARQLLDDRFGGEAAPERLALLGVVADTGLGDDDVVFLQSLADDRSAKVQGLARRLLARLGRVEADPDELAELCGFVTVTRKKLSRRVQVSAPKVKTGAQSNRRAELFETVPLTALAAGLGVTADELVGAWRCDASDPAATRALVAMVAATGTPTQAERLADNLLTHDDYRAALPLRPRMGPVAVASATRTLLEEGVAAVHWWCHDVVPGLDVGPAVLGSKAFRELCDKDSAIPAEVQLANTLALLCPPDVAAQAVERLRAAGAPPQYLDLFILSAELRPPSEGAR